MTEQARALRPRRTRYTGHRKRGGGTDFRVTEPGKPPEALKHRARHSPTGMEWGYAGSGPADLALSLLWDYAGRQAADQHYQQFKHQVIASLDQKTDWEIEAAFIEGWLTGQGGDPEPYREDPDPANMTNDDFYAEILELVRETPAESLLAAPGVYEALAEDLNNEAIRRWQERGGKPPEKKTFKEDLSELVAIENATALHLRAIVTEQETPAHITLRLFGSPGTDGPEALLIAPDDTITVRFPRARLRDLLR